MSKQLKQEMGEYLWGDGTLYIGLMAAFEGEEYVYHLSGCQGADGKLWRNPEEARAATTSYKHGVSRDMLAGFLLGTFGPAKFPGAVAHLCNYVRRVGRLSTNPDSRSDLRIGGWVALANACKHHHLSVWKNLGWRGVLAYSLFGWTEGLVDLLSSCTPQRGYQRHLVLVSLLTRKKQQRVSLFDRWTLSIVDYCLPNNPIVWYLQGDLERMEEEYPHHVNRAQNYAYEPLVYPWAEENFRLAQVHMGEWPVRLLKAMIDDLRGERG